MRRIAVLASGAPPLDRERCAAWAELLLRSARAAGEEAAPPPDPPPAALAAALGQLAGRGLLSYGVEAATEPVEVLYTPSAAAAASVLAVAPDPAPGLGFPEAVQKRQAEAFRTSQGAIFRFPSFPEEGDAIEVFITDWSPCPAAAAVAVHPDHPAAAPAAGPEAGKLPRFTGRYVRHPLTGDLLPVWVAEWVRPDFGTGAVLVNPGHDATDLAFGRAVGLPIRFALAPPGFDGSPASWLAPPVIRTGQSLRTGFYDGLSAPAAMERYLEVLEERGLARRHRDVQAGRMRIGRLVPDPAGELAWSPASRRLSPAAGGDGTPMRLEAEGALALAVALEPAAAAGLVCAAGEQAKGLLALRLLAFDLHAAPLAAAPLVLVQKVDAGSAAASPEAVRLAALVGAPAGQVVVLKQQVLEQAQRFLRVHAELAEVADTAGALPAAAGEGGSGQPALARVKEAILAADAARAFSFLQQQQKQLAALPPVRRGSAAGLAPYFAAASVLMGLAAPAWLDVAGVWREL